MKIVLPVHHFPPRYSAGAELYTMRLARGLQAAGHTVEVVCFEAVDSGEPDHIHAEADLYQGIPVQRLFTNLYGGSRDAFFDSPPLGAWFGRYLAQTLPDLVHFQAGYLIGAAPVRATDLAGIPSILTLHDYWYICPRITMQRGDGQLCPAVPDNPAACAWCEQLNRRSIRALDRLSAGTAANLVHGLVAPDGAARIARRRRVLADALAMPSLLLSPSQFLADMLRPYVGITDLRVVPLGIDLAPFQAVAQRTPGAVLQVGYTGQIAAHKGVHLLVEAVQRLLQRNAPIELHIHGGLDANPAYSQRLHRLAAGHPAIVFHGRYDHQRLPEILGQLDVTVAPSTWYENSPLAILESHAAGTPVITAAIGGMAERVRDGVDGLHFAFGDSTNLMQTIQRLIDQPDLLAQLRAGVQSPRSIEQELAQLQQIYTEVVTGSVCVEEQPAV